MQPIPLRAQIAELKRELATRRHVYAAMIERGTLDQTTAARRNAAMEAALKTLEHLAEEQFKAEAAASRSSRR